ncbi:MAG: hypothetical protein IT259_10030 [Saprospiraceae bacterium]|nr:hypothetical protein [Saprospiraceae bacterium]
MKKRLTQNWKRGAINGFLSVVALGLTLSLLRANNASFARAMDEVLSGFFQSAAEKNTSGQSGSQSAAPDVCSVTISRVDVSSCYYSNNQSKATVSVEVAWTDPPGGSITVTLGAQSRTITPGALIVSPQVVAFEVNADGTSGNISASFNLNCLDTDTYSLPNACVPNPCPGGAGVVGGKAFVDYNQDGVQQAGETNGQSDVEVRIYGCDASGNSALVANTTTDADGNYYFTGLTDGQSYRVEFTLSSGLIAKDYRLGNNGADSRTSVQFVSSPNCTTDIGVFIPSDYCDSNPPVFIPCYTRGNPLAGGNVAGDPALVSFPYNANGPVDMGIITMWADQSEVGSCWGVAYDKENKRAFSSAFLRRHTGLGPDGIGAIYVTDFTQTPSNSTGLFVDLSAIGANIGTVSSNVARGLLPNRNQPNSDPEGFVKCGKVGVGDIDITDNGDTLYFTNLNTRKLQSLRLDNDGNPNTPYTHVASDVSTFDLPNVGCGGGDLRPWGLKVYKGYVYVGAVCDAQASQDRSDLRAFVFRFTPGTNTWTTIFDFPLTYPKGSPFGGTYLSGWYPWTDNWNTFMAANGGSQYVAYPQPILCDIEFDIDGSMVLGFGDRTGYQTGSQDYNTTGGGLYWGFVGGDMLRVYQKNGAFVLENNAKAGPVLGNGANNNEGPGFGEFYNDIWNGGGHSEIMMGGLALLPGSGQIMAAMMDPLLTGPPYWSNGVRTLNNSDGSYVRAFCLFESADALPDGNFGKASGLGDLELLCALPTNTQIGNRIWNDKNKNGIQDPCETTLSNVKVELYDRFGNAVGVTTTNASGEYYFDVTNVDTIAPYNSGPKTGMSPNTKYFVVVGKNMTQWNTGNAELFVNGGYYKLSVANTGQAPNSDLNDNDGAVLSGLTGGLSGLNGFPGLMITSPKAGDVNHTYDFAFFQDIDYGDLPDNNTTGTYPTDDTNGGGEGVGPCHTIVAGLKIGNTVDFEAEAQPDANANGDDAAGDDEDGFTSFPDFVPGTTVTLSVPVMNMRGTTAYLYGFFDWNKNGKLDDPGETIVVNVPDNTNGNVTMNVPVPAGAVVGMNLGARFRISTNDDLGPTGCAEDGEVEDYFVQAVARDYGDLPDTYGTTSGNNGPSHIVDPKLFLGACVDAETNGIPQAMAGLMTGGDDNTAGTTTFGTCAPAGDDENGIIFESPLVPGTQACLRVTATNNTGAPAVLQAWIDYNGNGTFDAGAQLTTGAFAPTGAVIPVGGLAGVQLCFDVPAGATFQGGQAMSRFRISTTGGLTTNGGAGIGEV